MLNSISAKCKRCGKQSPSEQFNLDPVYGLMVCPNCVKERKTAVAKKEIEQRKEANKEPPKPVGWDIEDEYLERAYAKKSASKAQTNVQPLPDGKVKYTCQKCKYSFVYDPERKHPARCPYCSSDIFYFKRQF